MPNILRVSFPKKCNGCELCVLEAQRQLEKVGLDGALIRIFRDGAKFCIDVDPRIYKLDVKAICDICPRGVFTLEEEDHDSQFLG